MASIVVWSDYNSLHNKVNETDFTRFETLAEKECQSVIGPIRWANITSDTFGYGALQDCICNLIDKLSDDEKTGRGCGISAVSNDGYSENYTAANSVDIRNENAACIKAWLSGTGLVRGY